MNRVSIEARLRKLGDQQQAALMQRYFKTGPGQYAEGDVFAGVRVPVVRGFVRQLRGAGLREIEAVLRSELHEARLLALLLMVDLFRRSDEEAQASVYECYLASTHCINNWDLVDVSAAHIVGAWLLKRDRCDLERLAASRLLWDRRIAVVATHHFIRCNDLDWTFRIVSRLLGDSHDLMHKAAGWMLREAGKRDRDRLEMFLRRHARAMSRTMLRAAIERFPEPLRQDYLRGRV